MKKLFLVDISLYLLEYTFTGETTEHRSAEGATTQESLRLTANFVVIFIPAVVVLIFTGGFSAETTQESNFLLSLGCVVILSLFGTAMAKVLFNNLIQISTPVFASSVTYLMPIVALSWGLLDGEVFDLYQAMAALLILYGIYLANKKN